MPMWLPRKIHQPQGCLCPAGLLLTIRYSFTTPWCSPPCTAPATAAAAAAQPTAAAGGRQLLWKKAYISAHASCCQACCTYGKLCSQPRLTQPQLLPPVQQLPPPRGYSWWLPWCRCTALFLLPAFDGHCCCCCCPAYSCPLPCAAASSPVAASCPDAAAAPCCCPARMQPGQQQLPLPPHPSRSLPSHWLCDVCDPHPHPRWCEHLSCRRTLPSRR
jgi:hypothetical protein